MKRLMTKLKGFAMAILMAALAGAGALTVQAETLQYVAPVYNEVDGLVNPTNGVAYWVTNSVPDGYTVVESAAERVTWGTAGETSWYVVKSGTFQIDGGVDCAGNVNLVLCDGAKLTVTNVADYCAGIATDENGSFTVYGQPNGAGGLEVFGGEQGAGIGGGWDGVGSNITINGGEVMATGGRHAAGIGGGDDGVGSGITVNGGAVTATGGLYAAGIGSGYDANGRDITVNGGKVVATGGGYGAGIGGGSEGSGMNIHINSGVVFVAAPSGTGMLPNLIGRGAMARDLDNVNSISSEARVFFNLTGLFDDDTEDCIEPVAAMPANCDRFTVLTRGTQTVSRVLVGGYMGDGQGGAQEPSTLPWVLTNAVTGASSNVTVDVETTFAKMYCTVAMTNGTLSYVVREPMLAVTEQPGMTNDCTIAATTDGNDGIVNYAWCRQYVDIVGFAAITNDAELMMGSFEAGELIKSGSNRGLVAVGIQFTNLNFKAGGSFRFNSTVELTDIMEGNYGVLSQVKKGDEWDCTLTPVTHDAGGEYARYCVILLAANSEFTISNLRYENVTYVTLAEGETLTSFPEGKGAPAADYICRVTYGHEGLQYSADSDAFAYAPTTRVAIAAEKLDIEHATETVYVNDVVSTENSEGGWYVWSNETAYVVYEAEDGYDFGDGATVVTNRINTLTNPVTVVGDKPTADVRRIRYTAPVYKGTDNNPTNGIAHWVTNSVPDGYTVVESATERVTWGTAGATSWYVVTNGTFQIDGGVDCAGNVNLVLCDGARLTVTNVADYCAGIATDTNGAFTVYGQPDGAGKLAAFGGVAGAGIGGNYEKDGRNITISGGEVTATGGDSGAGIGGGTRGAGSDIVVNAGMVTATGGGGAAGIGGGFEGCGIGITINGGEVMATGGSNGAGIGGGANGGAGSNIVVNAGMVTATGGAYGAGIGGGYQGNGSDITIAGGEVTAMGGELAAGIGGGPLGAGSNIVINAGTVKAMGGVYGAGIGGGLEGGGIGITINGGEVTATGGRDGAGIGGGTNYGVGSNIVVNAGTVKAMGGAYGAGIGGGCQGNGSDITIAGGEVTAMGGHGGAGIGGGSNGFGANIVINAATVRVNTPLIYYDGSINAIGTVNMIGDGESDAGVGSESRGNVISATARVFFNLTGIWDDDNDAWLEEPAPMPEVFDGLVAMTPETLTVDRVLVGGVADWTASSSLALTNAVTGATSNITVNAAEHLDFAGSYKRLTHADDTLTLGFDRPVCTITQQPAVTNLYTITATTDGNEGITNYCWFAFANETLDFHALTNKYLGCMTGDPDPNGGECFVSEEVEADYYMLTVVWECENLSSGGVFHFTCTETLTTSPQAGTLTRDTDNANEWTFKPNAVDFGPGDWYMLYLVADVDFVISNLTYEIAAGHKTIAEGATLTAFPEEKGEAGLRYGCTVTYGHHGTYYTADSEAFTYTVKTIDETPIQQAAQTEVVTVEKPTETEEEVWKAATNIVNSVETANAAAIVADEVLTNAVTAAKAQLADGATLTKVLAEVTVTVTPTGATADDANAVRAVAMDVTPTLTTRAVVESDGTVTTNDLATTSEFAYSGNPMSLTFDVSSLADTPMLVVHEHGTAKTNYTRGEEPGETTFSYDAEAKTITLLMSSFSPLTIYANIQVGDDAWATVSGGVCTITGTGDMWGAGDWTAGNPLAAFKNQITSLVVESGVESIGAQAFHKFYALTNVTCAASVRDVGDYAFYRCNSLEKMSFATTNPVCFGFSAYTLQVGIYMKDGMPEIYPIPEIEMAYPQGKLILQGTNDLGDSDSWTEVTEETKKNYHFFRYVVDDAG